MKTITEIKQHFSDEEIKLLIEIIKGKQEFDVMSQQIKDFYEDEFDMTLDEYNKLAGDLGYFDVNLQNDLLEKLEFDLERGGLI